MGPAGVWLGNVGRVSHDSDERLVARMAAGDEAALSELHARYAPHLAALMRRMVGPHGVAEGVQEAFVGAWETAGAFEPTRMSARAWLVMTAHRVALSRVRAKPGASASRASGEASPDVAHSDVARPTAHSDEMYIDTRVAARADEANGFANASGGGGDAGASALELLEEAFYEGRSLEDLAAATGTSPAAVGAALRDALRRLERAQAARAGANPDNAQQDAQRGDEA